MQRVPSWNYLAVHCTVSARLVEEPSAKDALLKKLIGDHEPEFAARWRSFPEDFALQMLSGIMAFELDVLRWECKIKLNQHRPETLGQASRISGVTPAAISLLLVHLKKKGMGRTTPSSAAAGNGQEAA